MRFTPRRSSPTRRGWNCSARRARSSNWNLNFGDIATIWRGGCIIRAKFLNRIMEAYERDPALHNLLLDPYFTDIIERRRTTGGSRSPPRSNKAWPCRPSALRSAYFDSYRQARLPSNLLQAQRDFFGAHTYERVDKPGVFHTEWMEPDKASGRKTSRSRKSVAAQPENKSMPTYVYETTDTDKADPPFRSEAEHEGRAAAGGSENGRSRSARHFWWLRRARAWWINRPIGRFCRWLLRPGLWLSLTVIPSTVGGVPGRDQKAPAESNDAQGLLFQRCRGIPRLRCVPLGMSECT